jgi:glyoxylase-like metal-dependent hydrolase (beta-lactamase superfamily II)
MKPSIVELFPGGVVVTGWTNTHPRDSTGLLIDDVMLDCGGGFAPQQFERNLAAAGRRPEQVATVLLTHGHADHYGGIKYLPKAQLFVHELDAPGMIAADPLRTASNWYGCTFAPRQPDGHLRDGDAFRVGDTRIEVRHIPWHTPGSVCFVIQVRRGARYLFTGDATDGHTHPGLLTPEMVATWKANIKRLPDLGCQYLITGHMPGAMPLDAATELANAACRPDADFYADERFRLPPDVAAAA